MRARHWERHSPLPDRLTTPGAPGAPGARVIPLALWLGIFCVWLTLDAAPVYAVAGLVIRGMVTNATTHHAAPYAPVTLRVQQGGRVLAGASGQADARGAFALAAPPLPAGATYTVATTYRGVPYSATLDRRTASRPVQLAVYDTTVSDAALLVPNATIGVRRAGRTLAVIAQWTFVDASLVTDVGTGSGSARRTAAFPLPSGATNVAVRAGLGAGSVAASVERGAIVVHTILRPNRTFDPATYPRVTFTFDLPYAAGHPTLLIPTPYAVVKLDVFSLGSRIVAPGFNRVVLGFGGQRINAFEAQNLAPRVLVPIGVDGPPAVPPAPAVPTGPPPFPTWSVAILAAGGFVLLLLLALGNRVPAAAPVQDDALRRERARLIAGIAELDLQHARGRVPASRYRRQREQEKGRLRVLSRQLER